MPFPTSREADIAYQVLRVDAEPKRSEVKKDLVLESNVLTITLSASEARRLRVALTSIMESLVLVTETMDQFGPPASQEYSHH